MDINCWKHRLEELPLGDLHLYQELGSTNQKAEELFQQGAPQFTLVAADSQTKGRGRQGRSWITRPGKALAFSLILHPPSDFPAERLEMFSGLGALALAEAVQAECGVPAQIKWPNDVLVEGKKVAGVLVELHWSGTDIQAVVIGVGINVHKGSITKTDQLNFPAGSLEELCGKKVSRLDLLCRTLQSMCSWYPRLAEEAFLSSWDSCLAFKGEQVELQAGGEVVDRGELVGLASSGCLVLRSRTGEEREYNSGEIRLRRARR